MDQKDRWEHLKKEYENKDTFEQTEHEIEEKEQIPMTDEERKKLKKQMVILLWVIVIAMIAGVLFIFNFKSKTKNKETENTEIIENNGKELLSNGQVAINNATVKEINETFIFNMNNPLYEENILKIFNTKTTSIADFDFSTKMLFITSNNNFKKLVEDKKIGEEDKTVTITAKELEDLSIKIFDKDINLEHQDFKYFYEKDGIINYYDVIYKDKKYTFNKTTGSPSKIQVYFKMYSCFKEESSLYIESKVIFINENGVYADPEMTKLIGKRTDQLDNYVNNGFTIKNIYEVKNTGNIDYYFSETKTTSNASTPDYDFDFEEEVSESEKEHNKK